MEWACLAPTPTQDGAHTGGGSVMVLEGRGWALLLYVCQRRRHPGHAFILKIIEKQKVKNKYCF